MENISFYILLLICVTTVHSAKNVKKKKVEKEVKLTPDYFEEEAKKDIQDLLAASENRNNSEEDNNETTETLNHKNIEIKDQVRRVLKKTKRSFSDDEGPYNPLFTTSARFQDIFNKLGVKNRNLAKARPEFNKIDSSQRFQNLLEKIAQPEIGPIQKGNNLMYNDVMLRSSINDVNIKPEVYPARYISSNNAVEDSESPITKTTIIKQLQDDKIVDEATMRAGNDNVLYEHPLHKLINQLYHRTGLSTRKDDSENVNDDVVHKYIKSIYKKVLHNTPTRLRTGNNLDEPDELFKNVKAKDKNKKESAVTVLRTDIGEDVTSDINRKLADFIEQMNLNHGYEIKSTGNSNDMHNLFKTLDSIGQMDGHNKLIHVVVQRVNKQHYIDDPNTINEIFKISGLDSATGDHKTEDETEDESTDLTLRNGLNTRADDNNHLREQPVYQILGDKEVERKKRVKRTTFTQAGYTQDPDTCKTYNENLVKLWSNLSKFINVTEQPNERALHNIAMMIQAYLEHQNTKEPTETYKAKHEGPRDKITEVILRVKRMLEETDGSPDKITKIITKYLKPFYGDHENEECQQVNEESLTSSIDLLYKNFLENSECHGTGIVRNKKPTLRKLPTKNMQTISGDWQSSNSDYKPDGQSIIVEDELYKDFHKGKTPRQGPTTTNGRVVKRSRNQRSRPLPRSGTQQEKLKVRPRTPKLLTKRVKKSSLKSDMVRTRCERYATRKLVVSLRPVIERYMALLECQLDNTLRSLNSDKVSKNSYYLYASKFYSNEDNRRQKKLLPRSKITRKITASNSNMKQFEASIEADEDTIQGDEEINSPWVRKYSVDKISDMNSAAAVTSATNLRQLDDDNESDTDTESTNNQNNNEFLTTYTDYFQSPPLYDDYDGIYKTHLSNPNGFPSVLTTGISVNDKKSNGDRSEDKNLPTSTGKPRNDHFYPFYEEDSTEQTNYVFNLTQDDPDNTESPTGFIDLTKLKKDDEELVGARSKSSLKSYESITEFLKRARDSSLQTPEFAVPFALDSNKGYVELTHLVKYPKILVYRPQFIVKNTMPYDDFLKTINNISMTNDQVRLMKIVRHLPDRSVKVLFETEDFEVPLEIRNIDDNRRSGSSFSIDNYQWDRKVNAANKFANNDFFNADSESFVSKYRNDVRSTIMADTPVIKSERLGNDESYSASNQNWDPNSDANSTLNLQRSPSDSIPAFSSFPSLASGLIAKMPGLGSSNGLGSAVGSAVGSQIGSGLGTGLDTALSLSSALKLGQSSKITSYLSKILPSHGNTQPTSNPSSGLYSQSHINFHSESPDSLPSINSAFNSQSASLSNSDSGTNSLTSTSTSSHQGNESFFSSSTQSVFNRWWQKWKNLVKGKIKKIIGKMVSLADNIDHIVKL